MNNLANLTLRQQLSELSEQNQNLKWTIKQEAKMAEMPTSTDVVPDVPTVTVVHKVKSKLGYTEIHSTAEGFGDNPKVLS